MGLYSITFSNDLERDHATLESFRAFRLECEKKQFRYFLEVFNPNLADAVPAGEVGAFLNDHIIRALAGVTSKGRPLFLKIPYNGPAALEELAGYDSHLIIGVLGGSAGTAMDAFHLLAEAKKYGARVALFGRKINLAESPLAMVELLLEESCRRGSGPERGCQNVSRPSSIRGTSAEACVVRRSSTYPDPQPIRILR